MLFVFAIISLLGYAVQESLLARFSRRLDVFSMAFYRHMVLVVVMLPALFWGGVEHIGLVFSEWKILLLACVFGAIAEPLMFLSHQYLPVGISSALGKVQVILILLWSFVFLGETISGVQILFVATILLGSVFLALQKQHMPHLNGSTRKGVAIILSCAFFISLAFFCMGIVSRRTDPLVTAYFWEALISVFSFLIIWFRRRRWNMGFSLSLSPKEKWMFAGACSLTLLGTGGFALAVQYGSIGIVGAIGSASVVVTTILSTFLYHERLSLRQLLGIGIIIAGVVGLRMV